MFDWINNEMIAGFANWLIVIVPAIGAFIVGLRKYSSKALKYIRVGASAIELIDEVSASMSPDSDGGKKLTAKEIKGLQEKFAKVKEDWESLKK